MEKMFFVFWYALGALGLAGEALAFKLGETRKSSPAQHRELTQLLEEPLRLLLHVAACSSMGPFALLYLDGWHLVFLWLARRITGNR